MGSGKGTNKRVSTTTPMNKRPIASPRVNYPKYWDDWIKKEDIGKIKLANYYTGLTNASSRTTVLTEEEINFIMTEFWRDLVDKGVFTFVNDINIDDYYIKYNKKSEKEGEKLTLFKENNEATEDFLLGTWTNDNNWPTKINAVIHFGYAAANKKNDNEVKITGCNHLSILNELNKHAFPS